MRSRNRSLWMGTTLVGMMWAIGCGGASDNPLFAGDLPDAAADGPFNPGSGDGEDASIDDPGSGGSGGMGGGSGGGGGFPDAGSGGMGGGGPNPPCPSGPNTDLDGDGFTPAQGDCNDCDPRVNPGAFDYPGNGIDENCSGTADDEPTFCDFGLAIAADDPFDAAKALGICRRQQGRSWGLVNARWVFPDGSTASTTGAPSGCAAASSPPHAQSRGILGGFGPVTPRHGSSMLALSTGVARAGTHTASGNTAWGSSPGDGRMMTCSKPPPGFPISSPSCAASPSPTDLTAYDGIALELEIRVPTNAKSLGFDFDFYTFEFPQYYCSEFNDFFVTFLHSGHPQTPSNKNLVFDTNGNPISVNTNFLEVCKPQTLKGTVIPCSLGTGALTGTGFDSTLDQGPHGATGWLRTQASVVPGETIVLRFAIWDGGDHILDSTALIDGFRWGIDERAVETVRPSP